MTNTTEQERDESIELANASGMIFTLEGSTNSKGDLTSLILADEESLAKFAKLIRERLAGESVREKQPYPNHNWCVGCEPDNCSGCGIEPSDRRKQTQSVKDALEKAANMTFMAGHGFCGSNVEIVFHSLAESIRALITDTQEKG